MPMINQSNLGNNPWIFQHEFNVFEIPERMRDGVELYVNSGIRPGSFLQAVISNKLKEAVMWADGENMANLPAYANFFYNFAPHDCHGSEKIMEDWITKKTEERSRGGDL